MNCFISLRNKFLDWKHREDLDFNLTSLYPEKTGLDFPVEVQTDSCEHLGKYQVPRVIIRLYDLNIPFSLERKPQIIYNRKLAHKLLTTKQIINICNWIRLNLQDLLYFWYNETYSTIIWDTLKPLPEDSRYNETHIDSLRCYEWCKTLE